MTAKLFICLFVQWKELFEHALRSRDASPQHAVAMMMHVCVDRLSKAAGRACQRRVADMRLEA